MRAVIFSINRPHTDNIKSGAKISELRTRPPKIKEPYKAYIYETIKNGGCGKVIGEFIAFNENTYRMCMGVPKHLVINGCISAEDIWVYTNKGEKELTEISISDLVIYDKPRKLSKFVGGCKYPWDCGACSYYDHTQFTCDKPIRPPQSWCYVESGGVE